MTGQSEKVLLTVKEAAPLLSMSVSQVYELVAQGKIPSIRLGPRSTRIPRAGLDDYFKRMAEEDVKKRVAEFAPPSPWGAARR